MSEKALFVPGTGVTAVSQLDVAPDFKKADTKKCLHLFIKGKLQNYERT